jgi:S1-C subfamily serine protease
MTRSARAALTLFVVLLFLFASPWATCTEPPVAYSPDPPTAFTVTPPAAVAADPSASTVYVHCDRGNGTGQAGTGTVIACEDGRSLVLTNAHVVEGPGGISVTHGKTVYPATYLAGSKVTYFLYPDRTLGLRTEGPDLALVTVDAVLPAAPIADEEPAAGSAGQLVAVHRSSDGALRYGVPLDVVRAWVRERAAKHFPKLAQLLAARALKRALEPKKADPAPAPKVPASPPTFVVTPGCPGGTCPAPVYERPRRRLFRW